MAQFSFPELLGGLIAGGGLSQVTNWLTARDKSRQYAQGAVDRAMKGVSEQLARADARLELVEQHRDECDEELEASRLERAELRAQIDKLMAEAVPGYGPRIQP